MSEDRYGAHPKTQDELNAYIEGLLSGEHDYNSAADAMAKAAVATFNFMGSAFGVTGFQASWAGLQFIEMTRGMEHGFIILDGKNLLYPQYDLHEQLDRWIAKTRPTLAPEAKRLLAEEAKWSDGPTAHPDVLAHWRALAALAPKQEAA